VPPWTILTPNATDYPLCVAVMAARVSETAIAVLMATSATIDTIPVPVLPHDHCPRVSLTK
jgi:hypothetical protein